jgi:hypothetical protein
MYIVGFSNNFGGLENISLHLVGGWLLKINPFIFNISVTDNSNMAILQIFGFLFALNEVMNLKLSVGYIFHHTFVYFHFQRQPI